MNKIYPELHDLLKLLECPLLHDYPEELPEIRNSDYLFTFKHHDKNQQENKNYENIVQATDEETLVNNFFLSLADGRASAIARMKNYANILQNSTLFQLWQNKPPQNIPYPGCKKWGLKNSHPPDIKTCNEGDSNNHPLINDVITCITNKNLEHFYELELYRGWIDKLKSRAEDTDGKCPFASLYTHCLLTQFWHEFFLNNSSNSTDKFYVDFSGLKNYLAEPDKNNTVEAFETVKKYDLLRNRQVTLLRIKLHTYVKLARLRDIRIIQGIPATLKKINERLNGSSLYCFGHEKEKIFKGDERLLVTAMDKPAALEAIKTILHDKQHYYAEVIAVPTLLYAQYDNKSDPNGDRQAWLNNHDKEIINHNYAEVFKPDFQCLHPDFPKTIPFIAPIEDDQDDANEKDAKEAISKRILCDLCQMGPAEYGYPDKKNAVNECLCKKCFDTRTIQGGIAPNIQRWEKEEEKGEDIKLCFVLVSINMEKALEALTNLFKTTFGKELNKPELAKVKEELEKNGLLSVFGLPIFNEFLVSYGDFLAKFKEMVFDPVPLTDKEKIWDNLFCLKMEDKSKLADILDKFYTLFSDFFPRLEDEQIQDNKRQPIYPITISITYSNIKYPFYKHWELLTKEKSKPINVYLINSTKLETNFNNYKSLTKIKGNERISAFLHRVAVVEKLTGSNILTTMEFLKYTPYLEPIFNPMELSLQGEILPYYKIQRP